VPPRNPARLAVEGDIVFGLASAAPPQPFVGRVGDPAADGASSITDGLRSSSGAETQRPARLTINGQPVATMKHRAIDSGPTHAAAQPVAGLRNFVVDGQRVLSHGGGFQASPSGSLKSLGLLQPLAYCDAGMNAPAAEIPEGDQAEASEPSGSARTDFSEPSARHRIVSRTSTHRLSDLRPPGSEFLVGDPVDVSTGAVVTSAVDFERLAPPIVFARRYTSDRSHRDGPLGHGWSHAFDQALWLEAGRVVLRDDGREIEFDCSDLPDAVARAGDELHDPTGALRLRCHGRNHWELVGPEHTRHFMPIAGTSPADRDRGFARLTQIIRSDQPLTDLEYDDHGRLYSVRVDSRSMFTLRYDHADRIESFGDGSTRYEYSPAGDLVRMTDAAGNTRAYEYVGHLLVRETNRRGGSFYYGYDGHGHAAKCIRSWGSHGRWHRVLAYAGASTVVTDSLGHRTEYIKDALGLVQRVIDPLGYGTAYAHDDALRLTRITYADGTSCSLDYDARGRVVRRRERDGASWRMQYDAAGRLVEGADPVGGRWHFAYDFEGRLTRVQDPEGHVTRLEYVHRRLERIVDPLGRVTQLQLGPDDEVLRVDPPSDDGVTFEYDARGRLVRARPDCSPEVRWGYDLLGRVIEIASGGQSVRFERDEEGAIVRIERPDRVWQLERDSLGTLTGLHDDSVRLDYDYDTEGRMIRARRDGKSRIEVRRDDRGFVEAFVIDGLHDGLVLRDGDSGRLSSFVLGDGVIDVQWDAAGRIVEARDASGTRRFAYREDGLLVQFASPHRACTIERNALGVVVAQQQGDVLLSSPHVDHRGNRYGLDLGDGTSISYLWSVDGQLDRIAVAGTRTFDFDLQRWSPPRTLVASSDPDASCDGARPTDALHRPIRDHEGRALVWDEGHLLREGERLHVLDPRSGHVVAIVDGEQLHETSPSDPCKGAGRKLRTEEQAFADSFPNRIEPQRFEDCVPTPLGLLRQTLACRVWDPIVRPLSGALPWQPDEWHPVDGDVTFESTRLEPATLLRLLSPFPRPLLR
jgi:YD repeat-containing protein